jgi:hypothetical protein
MRYFLAKAMAAIFRKEDNAKGGWEINYFKRFLGHATVERMILNKVNNVSDISG